jgi:hypothetical protein
MTAPGKVTFAWNGKETEALIDVLGERGIGFELNASGLTVELAEGTTEEECRKLMAEALAERLRRKTRRKR